MIAVNLYHRAEHQSQEVGHHPSQNIYPSQAERARFNTLLKVVINHPSVRDVAEFVVVMECHRSTGEYVCVIAKVGEGVDEGNHHATKAT